MPVAEHLLHAQQVFAADDVVSMHEAAGSAGKQDEVDNALQSVAWKHSCLHACLPIKPAKALDFTKPTCTPCSRPLYTYKQIKQIVNNRVKCQSDPAMACGGT